MDYIPYTYLVTFEHPHTLVKQFYYGMQYARGSKSYKTANPANLGVTYFTSSKVIKTLMKEYGTGCLQFQIRKTFPNDPTAAAFWEHKVLRRMKVVNNPNWINRTDNKRCDGSAIDYSKIDYNKAKQTRLRNNTWYSSHIKNVTWDEYYGVERAREIKSKQLQNRKSSKGVSKSEATKARMSAANKGRPKSEEHKAKIRETYRRKKLSTACDIIN